MGTIAEYAHLRATRKKQPVKSREGLLFGPSRKQVDITNTPSPSVAARASSFKSFTRSTTGVFYTCPSGKQARVTAIHVSPSNTTDIATVAVNNFTLAITQDGQFFSQVFDYDIACPLNAGDVLLFVVSSGTPFGVVNIVEESI